MEVQQDHIKAFENTLSRRSYDNRIAMEDDMNHIDDMNMARGSVIIHKLIPLQLSTTTPSTKTPTTLCPTARTQTWSWLSFFLFLAKDQLKPSIGKTFN